MEKFEINEYGTLTSYHNDNKNITEIIIPDGVKYIESEAFSECGKFDTVVFPDSLESINTWAFWNRFDCFEFTVKYRGIIFMRKFNRPLEEAVYMIANKDYSEIMYLDYKYPIVLQIFFNDGDDVTTAYIKKNFKKFFVFLTEKEDYTTLEKLIKSGKFITKRNINTYIIYADEHECYEIFDVLNKYKEEVLK